MTPSFEFKESVIATERAAHFGYRVIPDVILASIVIEVRFRILSPSKVTSPFHTFNPGQVHILASDLKCPLTVIYPNT